MKILAGVLLSQCLEFFWPLTSINGQRRGTDCKVAESAEDKKAAEKCDPRVRSMGAEMDLADVEKFWYRISLHRAVWKLVAMLGTCQLIL